jgi:hypothetical protein
VKRFSLAAKWEGGADPKQIQNFPLHSSPPSIDSGFLPECGSQKTTPSLVPARVHQLLTRDSRPLSHVQICTRTTNNLDRGRTRMFSVNSASFVNNAYRGPRRSWKGGIAKRSTTRRLPRRAPAPRRPQPDPSSARCCATRPVRLGFGFRFYPLHYILRGQHESNVTPERRTSWKVINFLTTHRLPSAEVEAPLQTS